MAKSGSHKSKTVPAREQVLCVQIDVPALASSVQHARQNLERYYGSQEFEPHITLYLARFSPVAFRRLVKHLKSIPLPACKIRLGDVVFTPLRTGNILVQLSVQRTKSLMRMHTLIVRESNQFRCGLLRKKDVWRIEKNMYSKAETRRIRTYGSSRVLKNFHPHITLGTLSSPPSLPRMYGKVKKVFNSVNRTWTPATISVGLYRYNSFTERYSGKPLVSEIQLK